MSVLCCRIPEFIITQTVGRRAEWAARPLALLGPDATVWAASPEARAAGVGVAMSPRQAQTRCPDVLLQPLDLAMCEETQNRFVETLAGWELPVEPLGWGLAYLDLHLLARQADDVRPLAVEMGRQIRRALGDALVPALGWDSGKFTARAAAAHTQPGRVRLVDKAQEVSFLTPLPITLLPLPGQALQQLQWLGIRTLGEFAKLPATAVWQRFGQAGKLAQQWASGRDVRPVQNDAPALLPVVTVDIDPPTGLLPPVAAAVMDALRAPLAETEAQLRGWRRIRLDLYFVDGDVRHLDLVFVEPVADAARVQATLTNNLATLIWPAETSCVRITVHETRELPVQQLTLFAPETPPDVSLGRVADLLRAKYGSVFFRSAYIAPDHPVAERRARLHALP